MSEVGATRGPATQEGTAWHNGYEIGLIDGTLATKEVRNKALEEAATLLQKKSEEIWKHLKDPDQREMLASVVAISMNSSAAELRLAASDIRRLKTRKKPIKAQSAAPRVAANPKDTK